MIFGDDGSFRLAMTAERAALLLDQVGESSDVMIGEVNIGKFILKQVDISDKPDEPSRAYFVPAGPPPLDYEALVPDELADGWPLHGNDSNIMCDWREGECRSFFLDAVGSKTELKQVRWALKKHLYEEHRAVVAAHKPSPSERFGTVTDAAMQLEDRGAMRVRVMITGFIAQEAAALIKDGHTPEIRLVFPPAVPADTKS